MVKIASQTSLALPLAFSARTLTFIVIEVLPAEITVASKFTHSPPKTGSEKTTSSMALVTPPAASVPRRKR
ncbi:uncharacterized protein METZ01_LOCUS146771 [marine metagenome]|uniref:Uncharacterized protein n=1 Tax=marine metagenome TaxID=408172 RepID=A0A381ZYJ7_9ZZZZ